MKIRRYRKILFIQLSILATLILHYFVTGQRGYKAMGGEFLVIPLLYITYKGIEVFINRTIETKKHFEGEVR